jgi:hypothetical protein
MRPSDEECVRPCLNDHPEAFRFPVQQYQTALTRYLLGRLGNMDDATEAAQETFVRAYFALPELRKSATIIQPSGTSCTSARSKSEMCSDSRITRNTKR